MRVLCCIALLAIFGVNLPNARGKEDELPSAENVKFIFVAFRHGVRNPAQFMKDDTSNQQWAWEGPGQQTNYGKRQAYTLGQFLRRRYNRLIPAEFYPAKIKAYSPSAGCQVTMQVALAGLFPPKGRAVWNPALLWTPIPVESSDPLLRMALVKCPRYAEVYQPIANGIDGDAHAWLAKDPELVDYIANNTGFNATLSDMADAADNIGNMKLFNAPLPTWVTSPKLPGYPPKDIIAAITAFSEAPQIVCANNTECARLNAGYFLDHLIQVLQSVKNGTLKERVANFYAAHTETILSLIRLLKVDGVDFTSGTAGLILEYTDTPSPSVRFLYHEPDSNDPDGHTAAYRPLPYCDGLSSWCSLDKFVESVKESAVSDWRDICRAPKCP